MIQFLSKIGKTFRNFGLAKHSAFIGKGQASAIIVPVT